jgi:hypothetical protein
MERTYVDIEARDDWLQGYPVQNESDQVCTRQLAWGIQQDGSCCKSTGCSCL